MTTQVLPFSVVDGKENASFHQSTLVLDKSSSKTKGRKRTITLVSGGQLDLSKNIPATPEVVEAMRARIIQLEDELAAEQPPSKRTKTVSTAVAGSSSASSAPAASSSKSDEKKRKMQLKKIFDRVKKECKSDTVKFQGSPKTIKFDEILEKSEFDIIFGGKGKLIQPTPANKPKSTVTIIQYNAAHVEDVFGDDLKALKGNRWSRGGVPVRTFGAGFGGFGSTFAKSVKQGSVDVSIRSLEVNYSKNNMKCTLKFEVGQVYGSGSSGYDGYEDDSDY